MKIAIVVGTRPEIVKMAPLVRACRSRRIAFTLIHTGQHYSFEMDGVFFSELGLPAPHYNLKVGSGSHPAQLAAILRGIEPVLEKEKPDWVLVEGDTNSVLAAGLAAQKMRLHVGHVEAGLRSFDRRMPEESNRILTDHLSDLCFAPTEHSRRLLLAEGIPAARIAVTGNTVVDELERQRPRALRAVRLASLGVAKGRYAVATAHRPENVDDPVRLRAIFEGIDAAARALDMPALVPLHPRTKKQLDALGFELREPIRVLPPLGYLEFLGLQAQAALILTDSGGVQEEACCLRVPCVTMRDSTERPESVDVGANVLVGADRDRIVDSARAMARSRRRWKNPFGAGRAAERILDAIAKVSSGRSAPGTARSRRR